MKMVPTTLLVLACLSLGACPLNGDDGPSGSEPDVSSSPTLDAVVDSKDTSRGGIPDDTSASPTDAAADVAADAGAPPPDAPGTEDAVQPDLDTLEGGSDATESGPDIVELRDADTAAADSNVAAADTDGGPPPWDWPCITDGHCKDNDPCTEGQCVDGHCQMEPVVCPVGAAGCVDQCTQPFGCTGTHYIVGSPCGGPDYFFDEEWTCTQPVGLCGSYSCNKLFVDCNDSNPCTLDPPCKLGVGCEHPPAPDGTACDDGNPCTQEACAEGTCTVLTNNCGCDSGTDTCEAEFGDGDPCNGVLICGESNGIPGCVVAAGSVVSCDPALSTACSSLACNSATGQCELIPVATGVACDDASPCTDGDACDGLGACKGTPKSCDDGDPCTIDRCEDGECEHENMLCDDGNPWTDDVCTPTGCQHVPAPGNPTMCTTDGDCPSSDCCTSVCHPTAHVCMPGGTPSSCCCITDGDCDDGDPCTLDTCATGALSSKPQSCCGGCDHVPIPECCTVDAHCDDGNACTKDTCDGGKCSHQLDPALCLPADCTQIQASYAEAVAQGGACEKHEDCATVVPSDLACSCPDHVTTADTAEALAQQQATWTAKGCPAATGCPLCNEAAAPQVAVCIEGTCKQVADVSCPALLGIQAAIKGTLVAQSKSLACAQDADCHQCTMLVDDGETSTLYTHVSIDTTYLQKLDGAQSKQCCCTGDDGGGESEGPCCVDGHCNYATFCPTECQ